MEDYTKQNYPELEVEEAARQLGINLQAADRMLAQHNAQKAKKALDDTEFETLKEHGITPEQFAQLAGANMDVALKTLKNERKKAITKFIKKVTRTAEQRQQGAQQQPQQPAKSSVHDIAKARAEGRLSSDQAVDHMLGALLGDYFGRR